MVAVKPSENARNQGWVVNRGSLNVMLVDVTQTPKKKKEKQLTSAEVSLRKECEGKVRG